LLLQSELPHNQHFPYFLDLPQLVQQKELSTIRQVAWWYTQSDEVVEEVVEVVKVKVNEVVVEEMKVKEQEEADQLEALEVQDVQVVVQLAQKVAFELEVEYHYPPLAQAQMTQYQSQKALLEAIEKKKALDLWWRDQECISACVTEVTSFYLFECRHKLCSPKLADCSHLVSSCTIPHKE